MKVKLYLLMFEIKEWKKKCRTYKTKAILICEWNFRPTNR